MEKIRILLSLVITSLIIFIASCKTQPEIVLEEVDSESEDWEWMFEARADSINVSDSARALFKGQTWKEWRRTFKNCMKTQWIEKPFYFGPTSTVTLGAITTKDHKRLIWTADKVFTKDELNSMINTGSAASCEVKRTIELDLETTLQGEVKDKGNANIRFALQNAKSTTTSIDGFQVDNLVDGVLKQLLKDTTDPKKLAYRDELLEGKNVLLNKVIRVSGFTTDIELNNNIEADLDAELANNPELEVGNTGVKVRFSKKNETTITVKSLGDFVVFGKFVKGRKL